MLAARLLLILLALVCLAGCPSQSNDTTKKSQTVVTITPAAETKFKEFLRDSPGDHIRLSIKDNGENGFEYALNLESPPIPSGAVVQDCQGFTLAVSPRDLVYVEGSTIDWETRLNEPDGFKFDNPNAFKSTTEQATKDRQ